MKLASGDLNNVWTALQAFSGFGGTCIMFIGVGVGDNAAYCAREFAEIAKNRANKPIMLFDLDFYTDGQFQHFSREHAQFSGPFDLTFGERPFWRLNPAGENLTNEDAIVAARIDNSKLFISKCRKDKIKSHQSIQIGPMPDYWNALRSRFDTIIVDAPPVEKSRAGLAVVSDMDGVVLVIDNARSDTNELIALRSDIEARGGNCIGAIVVNDSGQREDLPY